MVIITKLIILFSLSLAASETNKKCLSGRLFSLVYDQNLLLRLFPLSLLAWMFFFFSETSVFLLVISHLHHTVLVKSNSLCKVIHSTLPTLFVFYSYMFINHIIVTFGDEPLFL